MGLFSFIKSLFKDESEDIIAKVAEFPQPSVVVNKPEEKKEEEKSFNSILDMEMLDMEMNDLINRMTNKIYNGYHSPEAYKTTSTRLPSRYNYEDAKKIADKIFEMNKQYLRKYRIRPIDRNGTTCFCIIFVFNR